MPFAHVIVSPRPISNANSAPRRSAASPAPIVNLDRVRALEPSENGDYDVVLRDRTALPASRRYRKRLQIELGLRA